MSKQPIFTMAQLDLIMKQCIADEYQVIILLGSASDKPIMISLEKGSTYGKMHMKFTAHGADLNETFTKCLQNFPTNPIGAAWDTKQITAAIPQDVTEGEFTEGHPPQMDDPNLPNSDDDIPF